MTTERRSNPREPADKRLCVVSRTNGSDALSATLDLSGQGLGLNLVAPDDSAPDAGDQVLVDLVPVLSGAGLMRVTGRVAWRRGRRLGVEFNEPLPEVDCSGPESAPPGLANPGRSA